MSLRRVLHVLFCLAWLSASSAVLAQRAPQEVSLPSAARSGNPVVDRIWLRYYPASPLPPPGQGGDRRAAPGAGPSPAAVLIPPIGSDERAPLMRRFAGYLAGQGIGAAILALPHHGWRRAGGEVPASRFAGGSLADVIQAFHQSASDATTVADWLRRQPGVDPQRIGIVGISLGAIVAHLAMGEDPRFGVGIAVLGGGDLPDLYRHSLLAAIQELLHPRHFTAAQLGALRDVDPLPYADRNRPRRVLMVQAARDMLIPPRGATELWQALGRPPIQWLDTNHFALRLAPASAFHAAAAYLRAVWAGQPDAGLSLPRVWAPTLKLGLLESGARLTPALQWQFFSPLMGRDHMALLHADLGLGFRGPFVGLAVTATPNVDLGLAQHPTGRPRPYVSLHLVF